MDSTVLTWNWCDHKPDVIFKVFFTSGETKSNQLSSGEIKIKIAWLWIHVVESPLKKHNHEFVHEPPLPNDPDLNDPEREAF